MFQSGICGRVFRDVRSVNITVTSITPYLPSSADYDNETFGGAAALARRTTLTPLQEVTLSRNQAEVQIEDATNRNVVWAAEGDVEGDADGEAEDDPDYIRLEDGTYKPIDTTLVPIGIRGQEGVIKALPIRDHVGEAEYGGVPERVPTKLQEMVGHGIWRRIGSD
jgi:meiosis-specific protein HOP1